MGWWKKKKKKKKKEATVSPEKGECSRGTGTTFVS